MVWIASKSQYNKTMKPSFWANWKKHTKRDPPQKMQKIPIIVKKQLDP